MYSVHSSSMYGIYIRMMCEDIYFYSVLHILLGFPDFVPENP